MYCIWCPLPEEPPTIIGLHFAADNIDLSSLKFFWWAHKFCLFLHEWRFSHSRSSKVTDVGTNRKRVCDFLLVGHSNHGPILNAPFRRYDSFYVLLTLPLVHPNFGVFPLLQIAHVGVNVTLSYLAMKLFSKYSKPCEQEAQLPQRNSASAAPHGGG